VFVEGAVPIDSHRVGRKQHIKTDYMLATNLHWTETRTEKQKKKCNLLCAWYAEPHVILLWKAWYSMINLKPFTDGIFI